MTTTMQELHRKKQMSRKITMLTCYDYPTALLQDKAGLDVIFVGDSLGTNELGYERETSVTLGEIVHHLKAVRRGVREAYLLADMPYRTYGDPKMAMITARELLSHGADGVKLEGMQEAVISHLAGSGIEVCAHLGYNPQFHEKAAVKGKTYDAARALLESAVTLQNAGASMIVLELIPEELGKAITETLTIPTIGIGAGRYTDGQVLIVHDMLGLTPHPLRHAKNYANAGEWMLQAFRAYAEEVTNGQFPQPANSRTMIDSERERFMSWYSGRGSK